MPGMDIHEAIAFLIFVFDEQTARPRARADYLKAADLVIELVMTIPEHDSTPAGTAGADTTTT